MRLATLVLTFVAGIALGYLLAGRGPRQPSAPVAASDTPTALLAPERETAALVQAPAKSAATTAPGAPPGDARSAVKKLFAAVPAPPSEEGPGEISGHVRLENGQPLEGALVKASRYRPWTPHSRRDDEERENAEEKVLNFVGYLRFEETFQREALTDGEGAYRLTGLLDSKYQVKASLDGFNISGGGDFQGVGTERAVDFIAMPAIELLVHVLLPDGSPAREAEIHSDRKVDGGTIGSLRISSPEGTRLDLREGSFELYALSKDRELRSETLALEAKEGVGPVTLTLKRRAGIEGKVIFSPEESQGNVTVAALLLTGQETEPQEKLLEAKAVGLDIEGDFTIPDLPLGRYLVGARRGFRRVIATKVVDVLDGYVSVDLVVPPPGPADGVLVRVYGPSGEALRDVTFLKTFRKGTKSLNTFDLATGLVDGSFRLPIEAPEEMSPSTGSRCFLEIESEDYGVREVEYRPEETQELDVRFEEPATLDIEVGNYRGSGQESRVLVFLEPKKEDWSPDPASPKNTMQPDAEGKLSLEKLQPGSYVLGAFLGPTPVVETPLELHSGKNSIRLDLPPRLAAPPERR